MQSHAEINRAKLFENRPDGFGVLGHRKWPFPIESVRRPYNSVGSTVPHYDTYLDQFFKPLCSSGTCDKRSNCSQKQM